MKYKNPILPGFYPDPSICRVGNEYYLVTSSFEYFPGIPVFYSTDLVNWQQIGHCISRESQLSLLDVESSEGLWAPTIRYNKGIFYVLTTNTGRDGHIMVHTENPHGEWSDPLYIEGSGFDPDLFFDDDGKVYFMEHDIDGNGITQWVIDIETGEFLSAGKTIWKGFEDRYCEGSHMYKIDDFYYLICAEGGTYYGHMIVCARSTRPSGEFQGYSQNPILTHRHHVLHEIQSTGHGDILQAHDGTWWAVFLGTRPNFRCHHLGRETFLAPVFWTTEGWPVINNNNPIEIEMEADCLKPFKFPDELKRDDFDKTELEKFWNFRRSPLYDNWSLNERPGWLKLIGAASTLSKIDPYVFIGRRQKHFNCSVSTLMEFEPQYEGEEAGLTVLMNENHHYEIAIIILNGMKQIIVRNCIGHLSVVVARKEFKERSIKFQIKSTRNQYYLGHVKEDGNFHEMASADTRYLSSEVAGGFTGVYFGVYATGNGKQSLSPAYFDWFEYNYKE